MQQLSCALLVAESASWRAPSVRPSEDADTTPTAAGVVLVTSSRALSAGRRRSNRHRWALAPVAARKRCGSHVALDQESTSWKVVIVLCGGLCYMVVVVVVVVGGGDYGGGGGGDGGRRCDAVVAAVRHHRTTAHLGRESSRPVVAPVVVAPPRLAASKVLRRAGG